MPSSKWNVYVKFGSECAVYYKLSSDLNRIHRHLIQFIFLVVNVLTVSKRICLKYFAVIFDIFQSIST